MQPDPTQNQPRKWTKPVKNKINFQPKQWEAPYKWLATGVARWNCKDRGSYYSATNLTSEWCQQGLPCLLLPKPCPASFLGSDLAIVWLRDEVGQCAGTAEGRFSQLTTHGLDFHWYLSFPRGSLHSETINYTLSWVLRFRNLAKVDFHLSWSLQTSHVSLLPLSTCLKAQCHQQFRARRFQSSCSQSSIPISSTCCSAPLAKPLYFLSFSLSFTK